MIVTIVAGLSKEERAEIRHRPDGTFEVEIMHWFQDSDLELGKLGDPYWEAGRGGKTICATLEIATREARLQLGLDSTQE